MKNFLLLSFLISAGLSAQNDDPRIRQIAPAPGVKSVSIKTVRYANTTVEITERTPVQVALDIHPKKDTIWVDTTAREWKYYAPDGKIESSYFKYYNPVQSYYRHLNDTSWVCITRLGWRTDSTIVTGNTAKTVPAVRKEDYYRTLYAGDSMHYVYYNSKGKQQFHSEKCSSSVDSFWDYKSAGPFAKKVVLHAANRDTVLYLDKKGRWMVKVINHYDSAGHPVKSEYYNRSVKKFDLISMWANHHVGDATVYLGVNGDRLSMTVRRTYDANGLLLREAWFYREQVTAGAVKFYSYTFWEQ